MQLYVPGSHLLLAAIHLGLTNASSLQLAKVLTYEKLMDCFYFGNVLIPLLPAENAQKSGKTGTRVNEAKKVLEKRRSEIKKKYAVTQTGVGYKVKDGRITDTVALLFYVDKKLDEKELSLKGIKPIPKEIDGIPTDVIEVAGGFKPRNAK